MLDRYFFDESASVRWQAFRLCLGAVMIAYIAYLTQGWTLAGEWLSARGYHVTGTLLPSMPVAGLLPARAVGPFGAVFFVSILYWMFSKPSRLTTALVLSLVVYVTCVDLLAHYAMNRMWIVGLLLMTVAGSGKGPAWPIRILQLFLVSQYFIAGWAKAVHGDWLTNPGVLWGLLQVHYMNGPSSWMIAHVPDGLWYGLQLAVVIFELAAPVLFLVRRLRWAGYAGGVLLHLGIALLMQDLIYFGLTMMAFYVLFIPEERLRRALKKFGIVSA